jgi:hypothetical protein
MDTLVYSSSIFLIPIQLAALKKEYILMNVIICLLLTSWAHHSNIHFRYINNTNHIYNDIYTNTIYDDLDVYMCYYAIYYTYMYAACFCTPRQCILYLICLFGVFINYYYVNTNINYLERGITNWKYHINHILMHVSACGCAIAILV